MKILGFIFCVVVVLSAIVLSSSYCGVWFVFDLLQYSVVCTLVVAPYLSVAIQTSKADLI